MLARIMSSNSERPKESSPANGAGAHGSLNSFVVNHQTPIKIQRRGGLPRVSQPCITASLSALVLGTCIFA